jgi:hypothetical protein
MEEIYDKAINQIALIKTKDDIKCGFSTNFYDLVPIIDLVIIIAILLKKL